MLNINLENKMIEHSDITEYNENGYLEREVDRYEKELAERDLEWGEDGE